jgi:chromosome segregation ATPase
LQNQHRKGEEGLNDVTELAVWKEKPQSGTHDALWVLRKYRSSVQEEKLSLTKESDALRTERDELKAHFDELKRKYSALKENLNVITEERDALRRDRDKLVGPEGRVKMIMEELSSIQEAHLILTQERDTLRSEHEELKVNFEELTRDCSALKDNLIVIREKCDALQRNKDALLGLEATVKMTLDEEFSIQNPHFLLTQIRDTFRSQYIELKVDFDKVKQECSLLRKDLNAIREQHDAHQKDKDKLVGLEGGLKMMLDELLSIQNAHVVVTQERDTLRSEHNELKTEFDEHKRKYSALEEKVNIIKEERDALQREKEKLVGLEGRVKMMLDGLSSIQNAHFVETQERDTLRSENNECDTLQREKENLEDLEGGMKMMSDEHSSIHSAHLIVTQERATLRSGREKLKVDFDKLKQECSLLKEDLNARTTKIS